MPTVRETVGPTRRQPANQAPARPRHDIDPAELRRWLLAENLAERNGAGGRLVPTQRAREIVAALNPLD